MKNPLEEVVASTILGSDDFISRIRKKFISDRHLNRDLPAMRALRSRVTVPEIQKTVEKTVPDRNLTRKISLYLAHRYSGLRLKEIGCFFGNIGESAVSQNTRRIEAELNSNKHLKAVVGKAIKEIV